MDERKARLRDLPQIVVNGIYEERVNYICIKSLMEETQRKVADIQGAAAWLAIIQLLSLVAVVAILIEASAS